MEREFTILDVSKLTIIRFSSTGQSRAQVTLVPPPNGIMTTLHSLANLTTASTSS